MSNTVKKAKPKVAPKKLSAFKTFGPKIKKSSAVGELSRLYAIVKILAANVKSFDFKADDDFYACMVEGRMKDGRKIASKRFSAAEKAGAKNLGEAKFKIALGTYKAAHTKWAK